MNNKKKVLGILVDVIFVVIVILFIYFFMTCKIYIIASGSMKPTLEVNEMIIVKKTKFYEVGDIITFYDSSLENDVTHRIVEITNEGYYTKGDFNNTVDLEVVKREQIVGKAIFHSYILGFAFVHYRFYLIFLMIITIIVLNNVLPIRDERRR